MIRNATPEEVETLFPPQRRNSPSRCLVVSPDQLRKTEFDHWERQYKLRPNNKRPEMVFYSYFNLSKHARKRVYRIKYDGYIFGVYTSDLLRERLRKDLTEEG